MLCQFQHQIGKNSPPNVLIPLFQSLHKQVPTNYLVVNNSLGRQPLPNGATSSIINHGPL